MRRDLQPPFHFNLDSLLRQARRLPVKVDGVSIELPFLSVTVSVDDIERKVAREVLIRLSDKRVLNAYECCDNCIEAAIASLQEIRSFLVDKQVELSDHHEGVLYLLLEVMLEGIRQFLTFEQRLGRSPVTRHAYFAALEMLRGHLFRSLSQVASIAEMEIPRIPEHMRYDGVWQVEAYAVPRLPEADDNT
jgi:hypothetical protein